MIALNNKTNILVIIFFIFNSICCFSLDTTKVNVAVKAYSKMLPPTFKIDSIYEVKLIQKVDLNVDGTLDKVIIWQRKNFQEGDTIQTSIFFEKNNIDVYQKTFNNFYSLDFSYWTSKSAGSFLLDSLKHLYGNSNYNMVEFLAGKIVIGVPISSLNGCDYFFIYDAKKNNWICRKFNVGLAGII